MRLAPILRATGWTSITAGVIVLLYLVYSLFFTNLQTNAAQSDLLEQWSLDVGEVTPPTLPAGAPASAEPGTAAPSTPDSATVPAQVDTGGAVAVLQFFRPGEPRPIVHADPLLVVGDVSLAALQRGPGHYPTTAQPGQAGNFAVAGHRTTYGAPFFNLDQLEPGDEVHVTDRTNQRWVYEVVELRIVAPHENWVLASDPINLGAPMLTLTTCHPRFSNAQRLVAFARLRA